MSIQKIKGMFFVFATSVLVLASHGTIAESQGGTLEVEALKLYMSSRSHAALDVRFTNTSSDDIKHWTIGVEVYDKDKNYLAKGEGMVSHIRAGASKVETILLLDTQAKDIASWSVSLGGVVGYSGLREDRKYNLKLKG